MKKPSIRDVADAAGVSVATVSRVLNNKPDTSDAARQKVEAAIRKLGYARSSPWVQLTTGKSRTISLHFPHTEPDPNPAYLGFISGATAACEERGYRLNLVTRPLGEADLLDLYRSNKSDGAILMRVQLQDSRVDYLREMGFPFVMIGQPETAAGASFVDYDLEGAIQLALDHLVALGHRHISHASVMPPSQQQHGPTIRALRAYTSACMAMGLPDLSYEAPQGTQSVRLMTARTFRERPEITAVIAIREMVEIGIYSAARDAGMQIPADLSVVGLTSTQGIELTSPSLTALDFPAWSMAYEAGNILIDQIEGVDTSVKEILRKPTLSIGGSTSSVRQG